MHDEETIQEMDDHCAVGRRRTGTSRRGVVILSCSVAEAKNLISDRLMARFFVAKFILSNVEGLLRMTSIKITVVTC